MRIWIDDVEVTEYVSSVEFKYEQSSDDDDLDHMYCDCSPDIALCGVDLTGTEFADDGAPLELPCIVCDDLLNVPCERCGYYES